MSDKPSSTKPSVFNVPNQLTIARLILAIVLFIFLPNGFYWTSMILFVVAALTDYADGYWARKYGQVTQLGRIMDPFADKIVICGTFIFLGSIPDSKVAAWMAVVIVGREILVTVLRSFIEQHGGDFSAKFAGKWKMVLQCLAVGFCLWRLGSMADGEGSWSESIFSNAFVNNGAVITVWSAIALTIYSGVEYIFAAIRMLREE